MANRSSSSEARQRRAESREKRRSMAAQPFEALDDAARPDVEQGGQDEQDGQEDSPGRAALKQAAVTAVAGAVAAGLGGAARALLDRGPEQEHAEGDEDSGDEERDEARPRAEADQEQTPEERDDEQPEATAEPGERPEAEAEGEAGEQASDEPDEPAVAAERRGDEDEAEREAAEQAPDEPDEREVAAEERGDRTGNADDDDQAEEPRRGVAAGDARDVVDRARRELEELLGVEAESISGFSRSDGGWTVHVEVVEVRRIPESTDVLSTYEVELDDDRNLVSVSQARRYRRSQVEEA